MRARDIMTKDPECCRRDDTAQRAAQVMRDRDCGCVPIVDDGGRVVGIVTDRDLAVRGIASGSEPNTKLKDLMTPVASCCGPDDDLRDVEQISQPSGRGRSPVDRGTGLNEAGTTQQF